MTTALEGGEWSAARPGHTLPLGKTRYQFYRRLGEPQGRSGWVENLVPTGIRSRAVQPVVSSYTDRATRPTHVDITQSKYIYPEKLIHKYLTRWAHHHIALTHIQHVNRHTVGMEPKGSSIFFT